MTKEHKMKKLVIIIMALVAMQVTAQEHRKEHEKEAKKERIHKQMNFTPEEIATLQTKKMVLRLDLTEAQQREIHKINLTNAKERKAKMEAHKKMREGNNEEKPSKEDRFKMMNERLDRQIANKKDMKRILSKEQFEKFERVMNHKQRKGQAQRQKNSGHKKQGHKRF
jgi:hypothetical protein